MEKRGSDGLTDRERGFSCRLAYELSIAGIDLIEDDGGWIVVNKVKLEKIIRRLFEDYMINHIL